jgi:hypothetical protein
MFRLKLRLDLIETKVEAENMRTEKEIRKQLELIGKKRETKGPFTERENIARKAIKQALLWVLEEVNSPLTY